MQDVLSKAPNFVSIEDLLYQGQEASGKTVAYTWLEGEEVQERSYARLYSDVSRVALALQAAGLEGKAVGVIGPYGYEFMVHALAGIVAGVQCAPIDRLLEPEEITIQCELGELAALLYHESFHERLEAGKALEGRLGLRFDELMENAAPLAERFAGSKDPSRICLLLFTSGTTGRFKVCQITEANLLFNVEKGFEVLGSLAGMRILSILPMHHVAEFVAGQLGPLSMQIPIAVNGSLAQLPRSLQIFQPSIILVVPRVLEAFKARIEKELARSGIKRLAFQFLRALSKALKACGIDLRRRLFQKVLQAFGGELALVLCGAAELNIETERFFEDLGLEVISTYGMTECAPLITSNTRQEKRAGSVGLVPSGIKVKLVDEEIWVQGPNVMLGYKDPQMQKESFEGPWFKTRDLGYQDEDGFLYLTGRKDNQIKLGNGEKVSPEELERRCEAIPEIEELMVQALGDKLVLQVYIEEVTEAQKRAVKAAVAAINRGLPIYKRLTKVFFRELAFIKTKTQKIIRDERNQDLAWAFEGKEGRA